MLDATPSLEAVAERFVGDPAFAHPPRQVKTSISGLATRCAKHASDDMATSSRHPYFHVLLLVPHASRIYISNDSAVASAVASTVAMLAVEDVRKSNSDSRHAPS